jgi:hypothetical protein
MSEFNQYINTINLEVISSYYHTKLPVNRIAQNFGTTSKEIAKIIAVSMATIDGDCVVIPSLINITKSEKL